MKITTVKYMKRKNLGNYEHEEISVEAILSDDESASAAFTGLKTFVTHALEGKIELAEVAASKVKDLQPGQVKHVDKISGAEAIINYPAKDTLENGQEIPGVIGDKKEPAKRRRSSTPATEVAAGAAGPSESGAVTGGASTVVGHTNTTNVANVQSEAPKASAPVDKGTVVYDSKIKEHRSRFATYLGNTFPNWKPDAKFGAADSPAKAEYAEKVRVFSGNLHGKAFEDSKGNMLESFKAELASFFSV